MAKKSADVIQAVKDLEQALAAKLEGSGTEGGSSLEKALVRVEEAVRRRAESLRPPDGKIIKVDRPRLPSPAVDRRAGHLYDRLQGFLGEIQGLREKIPSGGQAPGVSRDPATLAGALTVAPEAGAIPDYGTFLQQAQQLAAELEKFEEEEAQLILETVNTDIGSGD